MRFSILGVLALVLLSSAYSADARVASKQERAIAEVVVSFYLPLIGLSVQLPAPLSGNGQDAAQGASTAELAEANRLDAEVVKLYKGGKFDKALPLARRVAEIREQALGPDHLNVAFSLESVIAILMAKRKYDEAGEIYQRVVGIKEKTLGETHRDVGSTLEKYACLLWAKGKRAEANKIEKRIGKIVHHAREESELDVLVKGTAISLPQPRYPAGARSARMMGTVVVWMVIDETGKVVQASGRCADRLLVEVSVEAAYKARFKPTRVSGIASRSVGYATYNFIPQ